MPIGPTVPGSSLTFSVDGHRLAWTDAQSQLRLWDVHHRRDLPMPHSARLFLELSPDQRTFAVLGGMHDRLRLWSVDSGQYTSQLDYGASGLGLAFSPDGRTLATVGWSERLRLWDVPAP
jgi:WD40 repeat protein